MIATSTFQSERLLACGISADTADMTWICISDDDESILETMSYKEMQGRIGNEVKPAWSLQTLLTKVLPAEVKGEPLKLTMFGTGNCSIEYGRKIPFLGFDTPIEMCIRVALYLHKKGLLCQES